MKSSQPLLNCITATTADKCSLRRGCPKSSSRSSASLNAGAADPGRCPVNMSTQDVAGPAVISLFRVKSAKAYRNGQGQFSHFAQHHLKRVAEDCPGPEHG